MYEARQNKEKVSRRIETAGGDGRIKQRKESKEIIYKHGYSIFQKKEEIKGNKNFSQEMNPGDVHGYNYDGNTWSVLLDRVPGGISSPDTIPDMNEDYIACIITDPSMRNSQKLTRMHMVRAKFGGTNNTENLRFGTSASNNSNLNSHFHAVEVPISNYFVGNKESKRVDYRVNIKDASVPNYLQNRLNNQRYDEEKKRLAQSFLEAWCPSVIHCEADFYKQINGVWMVSEHESDVRMDLGRN